MSIREQKFIHLKILLCLHPIEELAQHSRLFKKYGVEVNLKSNPNNAGVLVLSTSKAREISWLFFQLEYVFGADEQLYFELITKLKPYLKIQDSINNDVDVILNYAAAFVKV